MALALTTTAIGTLLPVLRDSGVLTSPLGRYALAVGSVAEFGPIALIALFLGGNSILISGLLLLAFALVIYGAARLASRPWSQGVRDALYQGLHSSSQLPIRVTLLFIIILVFIAGQLGLDVLLGAFAAGVIVRITTSTRDDDTLSESTFATKLEAISFGMLVPVFFVISGTHIDLKSLISTPTSWIVVPTFFRVESTWAARSGYRVEHPQAPRPLIEGENLEVDPPHRLVQSYHALWDDDIAAEPTSRVTWEIEPVGDSCRLTVTHDQLEDGADPHVYGGWPMILSGLKSWLETGEELTTPGSLMYAPTPRTTS